MNVRGTQPAGFTLLELLVVLVVMGFLTMGLVQALHLGIQAFDRQSRTAAAFSDLDSIDRTLRLLIEHMDPGTSDKGVSIAAGSAHSLRIITELPAGMSTLASRGAEVLLRVDGRHRLELRWTAHPHATRIGPPSLPSEVILLDGVERLDFEYLVSRQGRSAWATDWTGGTAPRLIRLRLVFAPDRPYSWPDLVIAPIAGRET